MKIAKGDKVRFLNDLGGGVVTRIEGGKLAYVIDEDGFEIPALLTDVVLVEKAEQSVTSTSNSVAAKPVEEIVEVEYQETEEEGEPTVLMAFIQKEQLGGNVDLYLINDSNFFIYYVINKEDDGMLNHLFSGQLEPNTKVLLDTVSVNYLDGSCLSMQGVLFRKDYSFHMKSPIDEKIKIKGAQLMKDSSYVKNDFFNEKAFLCYILKDEVQKKLEEISDKELRNALKDKFNEDPKKSKSPKHNTREILEVDLHIHELLDDTRGLSNKDMLDYQMEKFHEVLRQNAKNKNKKIVFIHGKGNGVLKSEILRTLKHQYKTCTYQDASFREYGFGATMVII